VFALEVEDKEEDINPAKYSEWGKLYDDILWIVYRTEEERRERHFGGSEISVGT